MAGNRLTGRSRQGIPPALRAILRYIETTDSTSQIDFDNNLVLNADDRYIAFGVDGVSDGSIYFNGTSICIKDATTGVKTLAELATGTNTLDQTYDLGKLIDGSAATGAANAFSVGGAAADDKVEIFHNATKATINCRAGNMDITAQGGTISFNDDNLSTTGTLGCYALTCRGITNTVTAIDTTAAIQIGADNVKLSMGIDDTTDSYLQFDSANLDIYSSGSIDFLAGADTDDYIRFTTTTSVPSIVTTGTSNLTIAPDGGTTAITGAATVSTTLTVATTLALATASITDSSGAIDFGNENLTTQGTINIAADNVNYTIGASGATDAYWYFDGAGNLTFYDSNLAVEVTLTSLASGVIADPTISGDVTISNGKLNWTDSVDEVAGTWAFTGAANGDIAWTSSITSAYGLDINADSITSGYIVHLDTNQGASMTGGFFQCWNGTDADFAIKRYGEIEIKGNASTTMLTITAGDVVLTAGDITLTLGDHTLTDGNLTVAEGKFELTSTSDEACFIKRTDATGTAAVLKLWQAHATPTTGVLHVDSDATGDANAINIDNAGTGYSVSTTAAAAGGGGYEFISAASGTNSAFLADGSTGGAAWIGAAATGLIQASSDGALADVAASLCYLAYSGNAAAANQTGSCLNVVETGAASGTSYAVGITTTNNQGMQIVTTAVGTTNLKMSGGTGQTASMAVLDGTPANGWIGAAGVGMLHLKSDGALANAGASILYSTYTGNTAAVVPGGSCAYFYENGTIAAGGYAVLVAATGGGALNVTQAGAAYKNVNVVSATNQTVQSLLIDGDTNGWLGAANVGMVHIQNDIALGNAAASMLLIDKSAAIAEVNDARGTCLRIVENMEVAASAPAYAMYISSTANEALLVDSGYVTFDEKLIVNGASAGAGLGHIKIGLTADHAGAAGENVISIKNGAAKPAGALANGASLYAEGGELEGIDSGGAESTLTPHTMDGDYIINSFDPGKDATFRLHLELLCEWLVKKFPEIKSYVEQVPGRIEKRPRQSKSPKRITAKK